MRRSVDGILGLLLFIKISSLSLTAFLSHLTGDAFHFILDILDGSHRCHWETQEGQQVFLLSKTTRLRITMGGGSRKRTVGVVFFSFCIGWKLFVFPILLGYDE